MRVIFAIINLIALIGAIIWWLTAPDWEPAVTSIGLLNSLLTQIFTSDEIKSRIKLIQKSKKGSHIYQAAGNQTITDKKKIQKGGKDSQQLQADKMTVHIGINEKRAREIYQEMRSQSIKEYSQEAFNIANIRVAEFEKRLMPKMDKVNGALEVFADPSFQLLLVEAQKTAASTERSVDYDLLSELLIHRFQKGEDRNAKAAISRAVEIVDKISDDALLGLTVSHAIGSFSPVSGDIYEGLNILDELFGKIIYGKLPVGNDWIDHLEILNTVRLIPFSSLSSIQGIYTEMLPGYIEVGIEKDSVNHREAVKILESNKLPLNTLVDHVFNNGFFRINISKKNRISSLKIQQQKYHDGSMIVEQIALSEEQVSAINSIFDLYKQDKKIKQENIKSFMEEWDKRPNLRILREWWDKIGFSFQITSVGKILAHSNAQRCDKNLPSLD